jgi:6-pyruvoyltetrahydropterin/6-carboxytetrahydropterin synthase
MTRICKSFKFAAAHRLLTLPESHKCHRLHGHSYRVDVELVGDVESQGFVVDFAVIEAAWAPLFAMLDHHFLNEVEGLEVPTSENLAAWVFDGLIDALPLLDRVRVWESDTSWAEVERGAA